MQGRAASISAGCSVSVSSFRKKKSSLTISKWKETMEEKDAISVFLSFKIASTSTTQRDSESTAVKTVICQNSFKCQSRQVYLVKYFVVRVYTQLGWILQKIVMKIPLETF